MIYQNTWLKQGLNISDLAELKEIKRLRLSGIKINLKKPV